MYADEVKEAETELWTALDALQKGDLSFARSSAARAQSAIVQAYRLRNKEVEDEREKQRLLA